MCAPAIKYCVVLILFVYFFDKYTKCNHFHPAFIHKPQNAQKGECGYFRPSPKIKILTNSIRMSSVQSGFANTVSTNNFVVRNFKNDSNYPSGTLFLESDFDTWFSANSTAVTKLGSYYVVNDSSNVRSIVDDGSHPLDHTPANNILDDYIGYSLRDMGKEICIGTDSDPRLLVFSKVKLPYVSSVAYGGIVGYVVTQNNTTDLTRPRLRVYVCRT